MRSVLAVLLSATFVPVALPAAPAAPGVAGQPVLVEMEVAFDGHEAFHLTVWSGQAATFRSKAYGLSLVLVPRVDDRVGGDLTLHVGEASGGPSGTLVVREGWRDVPAKVGFDHPLGPYPLTAKVLQVRLPDPVELLAFLGRGGASLPDSGIVVAQDCCVSCGGDTLCGCRVTSGCGFCCDGCCGSGLAK